MSLCARRNPRGACQERDCDCDEFVSKDNGLCTYCGHTPEDHQLILGATAATGRMAPSAIDCEDPDMESILAAMSAVSTDDPEFEKETRRASNQDVQPQFRQRPKHGNRDRQKAMLSPVTPPHPSAARVGELHNIFYDLETDGFGSKPNIIQIAACDRERKLNRYVMPPNGRLPAKITEITGLSVRGSDMYWKETKVKTVTLKTALRDFISFLVPHTNLVGHNIWTFDNRILWSHSNDQGLLSELQRKVDCTTDTLAVMKSFYPGRKKEYEDKALNGPYKQENLVKDLLKNDYDAHNALADVIALQRLVAHCSRTDGQRFNHIFTSIIKAKQNKDSLQPLTRDNILSTYMAKKVVDAGLGLDDLKLAYQRGGTDGVRKLFAEKNVTNKQKIIDNVVGYLKSLPRGSQMSER